MRARGGGGGGASVAVVFRLAGDRRQWAMDRRQLVGNQRQSAVTRRQLTHTVREEGEGDGGGEGWHEAMVLVCMPLAVPIGLSPLHIPTLCGSQRVLVASTEPRDDFSCLTTPGSAVPETGCCPCR